MIASHIYYGTIPLIEEGPTRYYGLPGELDTVNYSIRLDTATASAQLDALGLRVLTKVTALGDFYSMWVDTIRETEADAATTLVSVSCSGLIYAGDKVKETRKLDYTVNPYNVTGENGAALSVGVGKRQWFETSKPEAVATRYADGGGRLLRYYAPSGNAYTEAWWNGSYSIYRQIEEIHRDTDSDGIWSVTEQLGDWLANITG